MATPAHHYKFDVTMTCGGCSGAVDRVLKKMDGTVFPSFLSPIFYLVISPKFLALLLFPSSLSTAPHPRRAICLHTSSAKRSLHGSGLSSYDVSLENKTADVYTDNVSYEAVLEKIKKTGKAVTRGEADGKEMQV